MYNYNFCFEIQRSKHVLVVFMVLAIKPTTRIERLGAKKKKKKKIEKNNQDCLVNVIASRDINDMVLPSSLQGNFPPSEITFFAENELITVLPRYSIKKIDLIGTRIPNLRAMRREQVPLWVALILKSQDKCSIVPPKWLNVAFLKEKYDDEVRKPLQFSDLPWNWLEVSKILLDKASDDLLDPVDQLRSVIQDLREVRLVKTKKGFKELNESNIQLNGLSLLEINEIRPFVIPVMNKLRRLHETTQSNYSQAQDEEMEDVSDEEY